MRRAQTPPFLLVLLAFISVTTRYNCNGEEQEKGVIIRDKHPQQPPRRKKQKRQLLRRWRYASPVVGVDINKLDIDVNLLKTEGDDGPSVAPARKRKWTRSRNDVDAKSSRTHNLNCTYSPPRRQRHRLMWRRKKRKLTRKAYRMAVLAKLAYFDFRKDVIDEHGTRTCASTGTCFALADDPGPPQYLLQKESKDTDSYLLWGNNKHTRLQQLLTGMSLRVRMLCCRAKHHLVHIRNILQYIYDTFMRNLQTFIFTNFRMDPSLHKNKTAARKNSIPIKTKCQRTLLNRHETGRRYKIEWTLQNWHEASVSKLKWHDTDLIIATSGTSEIVLSFAGTASTADQFTNIQTLEPVEHSGLFGGGRRRGRRGGKGRGANIKMDTNSTSSSNHISGSIHRGFLNAYSRVVRGNILRLCDVSPSGGFNHTSSGKMHRCRSSLMESLHHRYDKCMLHRNPITDGDDIGDTDDHKDSFRDDKSHNGTNTRTGFGRFKRIRSNKPKKAKKKKKKSKNVSGCQSRDEKLVDILREIVTDALHSGQTVHLTGHSQGAAIATLLALDMVINSVTVPIANLHLWSFGAPEVADSEFYESATRVSPRLRAFLRDRRRYHRFVTRAHNCETDFITTLVSKGLNRRGTRRIGGVRGNIVHAVEPAYVPLMAEKSGIEGHFITNYLKGISIESPDYPLSTDFPSTMRGFLGEVNVDSDLNSIKNNEKPQHSGESD